MSALSGIRDLKTQLHKEKPMGKCVKCRKTISDYVHLCSKCRRMVMHMYHQLFTEE